MIAPRFLRVRDAHGYCGMSREIFNNEIRPYLVEIQIGTQGVAFDRLDLDDVLDDCKSRNGRPAKKGGRIWVGKEHQVSSKETGFGTSTRSYTDADFAKVLELATSKKPSAV